MTSSIQTSPPTNSTQTNPPLSESTPKLSPAPSIQPTTAAPSAEPSPSVSTSPASIEQPAPGPSSELAWSGQWLRIAPYGDFDNAVGLQRIQREDADAMVAAFNDWRARLARLFRGLPIYAGHPDMEPSTHADRRRYGRIDSLEARADGLYGLVRWNELGAATMREGYYVYNSPAWYLRREGNLLRPTELISVGLTNTPQIPNDPWSQNEAGGRAARAKALHPTAAGPPCPASAATPGNPVTAALNVAPVVASLGSRRVEASLPGERARTIARALEATRRELGINDRDEAWRALRRDQPQLFEG